jgi:hypothetical protein
MPNQPMIVLRHHIAHVKRRPLATNTPKDDADDRDHPARPCWIGSVFGNARRGPTVRAFVVSDADDVRRPRETTEAFPMVLMNLITIAVDPQQSTNGENQVESEHRRP